jgi:hypothetical protein
VRRARSPDGRRGPLHAAGGDQTAERGLLLEAAATLGVDEQGDVVQGHAGTVRLGPDAALTTSRQRDVSAPGHGARMARAARQRAEILATIRAGDLVRARILGVEHLLEFPDDHVVRDALERADCDA